MKIQIDNNDEFKQVNSFQKIYKRFNFDKHSDLFQFSVYSDLKYQIDMNNYQVEIKDKIYIKIGYSSTNQLFLKYIKNKNFKQPFLLDIQQEIRHIIQINYRYTGEKNNAFRLRKNIDDIKQMLAPFRQMCKNNFQDVSAFDYNQEVRGKYFFGIDQAMQNIPYDNNVPDTMIKIIRNHIDFSISYIKEFPNYFTEYNKIYSNPASLFYETPVAIAHGSHEIFQLLLNMFGSADRLINNQNCFYSNLILQQFNERIVKIQHSNLLESDNDQMQDEIIGQNQHMQQNNIINLQKQQLKLKIKQEIIPIFINYFWLNGGIDAMTVLFQHQNKMIPLSSLLQIIKINCIGIRFMKEKYLIPLIELICSYVIQRMNLLTEREVKEYDPNIIKKIREKLQEIVKSHHDNEAIDIYLKRIDIMDLNLALKLLSSNYLNKKIQGLNDISEIISEIKQNENFCNGNSNDDNGFRNNSEYQYSDQLNDRRINPKEFTDWVIQNKIIDHLLGDSMHVEIVRRCHEIIRFICYCKQFPVELIDTIWNSCGSDKHEATVSAIYEMIIQITDQLSKEALIKLHEKINSIPLHEINELTLTLIRGFSQKAIDRLIPTYKFNYNAYNSEQQESEPEGEMEEGQDNENKEEHKENKNKLQRKKQQKEIQYEKNFFCLDLLLKLINEDNNENISLLVVENALNIAKDIFCLQQGAYIAKKYVNLFLEQIMSGKSSYQAYYLIHAIIDYQCLPEILIQLQQKQINLPQIIVDDICCYLQSIPNLLNKLQPAALENLKNQPNQNYAFKNTVFKGKQTHEQNILVRFSLLETILIKADSENKRIFQLTSPAFDKLWNQFINNANNYIETQIFLNWIHIKTIQKQNQNFSNHIDIAQLFSLDLMKHIFFNIFCNSSVIKYSTFNPELFNIFFFFFKKINSKLHNIDIIYNLNKFKVINEELAGMKTMWDIFGEAENKIVVTCCCDQLSEIYINHERNWEPQFRDHYMRQLTEKSMQYLQEGYNKQSSQLIERAVQLLIQFFQKIEGVGYKKQYEMNMQNQYSQYQNQVMFTFILLAQPENIKKEIRFNTTTPFGLLRKRVAIEFKLPTTCFRLQCKATSQYIQPFQDEETIHAARNVYYVHLIEGADKETPFHPKNFITQNNEYFDLLFSLLSLNFPTVFKIKLILMIKLYLLSDYKNFYHIENYQYFLDYNKFYILFDKNKYFSYFKTLDECHNNLWDLILKLPQNEHVKQRIFKMQEPWDEILKGSFHKKLYCLNIMDEFLSQNEPQNNQWLQRFIHSNGYRYLYEYLSQLDMNIIQNALSKKFVKKLLKIISQILEQNIKGEQIFADTPDKGENVINQCFLRIVECIHRICEYCILREEKDLENCQQERLNYQYQCQHYQRLLNQNQNQNLQEPRQPEFYATELEIVQSCFQILLSEHNNKITDFFCHPLFEKIIRKGLAQIDNQYLQQALCQLLDYIYQFCKNKLSALKQILPILLQNILPDIVKYSKVNGVNLNSQTMIAENAPTESFKADQTRLFFKFSSLILNKCKENKEITKEYDFSTIAMNITEMIVQRPIMEISQNNKDEILIGLMILLKEINNIEPSLNVMLSKQYNLIKLLLDFSFEFSQIYKKSDSIFLTNSSSSIRGPKIKTSETRKTSFDLLQKLSLNSYENIYQVITYLKPLILSGKWRTKSYKDWDITPKKNEKSSTGYVGLQNLGCICYMNSLLQQLFMIPSFRQTILRCKDPQYEKSMEEDNLLYQLKCMFTALCYSEKEAYNPKSFCHAFKDYDGNPTNVFEQMDIDEFFNSLMDKLENQMKDTKHADAIKKHFGGVFSNEFISKGCSHYSEREEAFLSISLQVKTKKDIKLSLEALTQGEMLEGDNSYHCEKCDKKVPALKRTCLKKLPNHLILVLKRFEFNYDNMQKVKINQFCSFPDEIDFQEFSQQGLRKAEQAQDKDKKASSQQQNNDIEYPDNYFKYQLNGIVIHMGIADSGHYYSYIRDRESNGGEKWMEFNDNVVKFFDPKDIPNEAFGGEEKWKQFYMMENMGMMNALRQKIRNAYLLFYDRVEMFDEEQFQQNTKNNNKAEKVQGSDQNIQILEFDDDQEDIPVSRNQGEDKKKMVAEEDEEIEQINQNCTADAAGDAIQQQKQQGNSPQIEIEESDEYEEKYCGEFRQELFQQNQSFHLHKILFSQEFYNFILYLIYTYNVTENRVPLNYPLTLDPNNFSKEFCDLEFIKFSCTYFFTTAIRQRVRNEGSINLDSLYYFISIQLNKCYPANQWLIRCFTDLRLVREIIMSPSSDAKELVISLLDQSCRILYQIEKNQIHEVDEDSQVPNTFLGQFINCLITCFNSAENYQEYFELFYRLITFDDEIAQFFVNRMFIGRIVEFLFQESKGKKKSQIQGNLDFPKTPYTISESPMMGLPAQEKQKKQFDNFYKKDRMGFADSSSLTYILKVLDYLISRSTISTNNPSKIPSKINYFLQKDEIAHLYKDEALSSFIQKSKDKSAVKAVNNILAYLSYEDSIITEYLCNVCAQVVQDQQCQEFSRAFSLLKKVFAIQDSLQQRRIEVSLQKMFAAIEQNSKYQKETDVCQQFLIKLAQHSQYAAQVIHKNQQHLNQQIKIIIEYRPNKKDADENQQKRERIDLNYYDIKLPQSKLLRLNFNYINHSTNLKNWKLKQFEKLRSGDLSFEKPEFDTDDVLADNEMQKGRYYDFFDEKQNEWKVVRCYDIHIYKRVGQFYEVMPSQTKENMNEEKQFYEKSNQLLVHVLPFGTYKIVPFRTMADQYSIQFQSDPEENDERENNEVKEDDNDDKKTEEEIITTNINQQERQNNQNANNQRAQQNNPQFNQAYENQSQEMDNENQSEEMELCGAGDENQMNSNHEYFDFEYEESEEEQEEDDEEEDQDDDQNTASYQQ